MRLPRACNHDTQTTVLAHLRCFGGGGMGTKPDDICAIYCCSNCHDILDGRARAGLVTDLTPTEIRAEAGRALCETIARMVEKGLLRVEGT